MKIDTNHISPLPPQQQKVLYRWYTLSVYLATGSVIIFLLINSYQYIVLKKLQHSYQVLSKHLQELQNEAQQYDSFKKGYDTLQIYQSKIDTIIGQKYNPIGYLQNISEHIPGNVCLTEFSYTKNKELSFRGYAQTATCALNFITNLAQLADMKDLQLISLHPTQLPESDTLWYEFQAKKLYR